MKSQKKLPNMYLWWEIHEKHEEALLNHTTFETDDNIDNLIHMSSTPKPKKKRRRRKKKAAEKVEKKCKTFKVIIVV